MREIETDYLVVGAGASGMAFVDALLASSDASVVMVDRRHRPGGHWLDAYPFVRIHQASANYGVNSRPLGADRVDESGPNAGFYERATAVEICAYFGRVLDDDFLPSGRVEFLPMSDYRGEDADGHHVVSLVSGAETLVKVRRRLVDATYVESTIPSRHAPGYEIDAGVRVIPPNDLVDLDEPVSGFTVIGAGKTAIDTCCWLLDAGVDPGRIEWIRTRDPWLIDRALMQPLDLVGAYMQLQASWVEAAAAAETGSDFAHRLEDSGVLVRIDPNVEPEAFRGAIVSRSELESVRRIDRVVRAGRVQRVGTSEMTTESGSITTEPGRLYVDCTAAGIRPTVPQPIFGPERICLQYVTIGIVPWGAAIVGTVEALHRDDDRKNELCPVVPFSGNASDMLRLAYAGMSGLTVRGADPEVSAWDSASRLNPSRAATEHFDDPRVASAFASMAENIGQAMRNLKQRVSGGVASA